MTVELIFVWEGGSADIKCRKIALNLQVGGKMLVSCRAAKQTRPSLLSFLLGPIVHMGLSPLACERCLSEQGLCGSSKAVQINAECYKLVTEPVSQRVAQLGTATLEQGFPIVLRGPPPSGQIAV